jgi:hypothetical protein
VLTAGHALRSDQKLMKVVYILQIYIPSPDWIVLGPLSLWEFSQSTILYDEMGLYQAKHCILSVHNNIGMSVLKLKDKQKDI